MEGVYGKFKTHTAQGYFNISHCHIVYLDCLFFIVQIHTICSSKFSGIIRVDWSFIDTGITSCYWIVSIANWCHLEKTFAKK
jgi:hypothetical protein